MKLNEIYKPWIVVQCHERYTSSDFGCQRKKEKGRALGHGQPTQDCSQQLPQWRSNEDLECCRET